MVEWLRRCRQKNRTRHQCTRVTPDQSLARHCSSPLHHCVLVNIILFYCTVTILRSLVWMTWSHKTLLRVLFFTIRLFPSECQCHCQHARMWSQGLTLGVIWSSSWLNVAFRRHQLHAQNITYSLWHNYLLFSYNYLWHEFAMWLFHRGRCAAYYRANSY